MKPHEDGWKIVWWWRERLASGLDSVRSTLEATCQIDKCDELRGKDGKMRPVRYKKIITNTPKEAEAALKVIGDWPKNCARCHQHYGVRIVDEWGDEFHGTSKETD